MESSTEFHPLSLLDSLSFDIQFEALQFLQASDLSMLALTNNLHNSIVSNEDLWRYFYERDFNSSLPQSSSISPQQLYQIRMMNDFMNLEREKSFLHLSNLLQKSKTKINPFQNSYSYGIWTIDYDRIHGYTYLEDNKGLGIELAFTSNGWFRFKDYSSHQLCVYSSSEIVNQNLHVTEARQSRSICDLEKQVVYTWGEWTIICDIASLYIVNNTDQHQVLILSPFENGFVFFPTDKNPSSLNNVIIYPEHSSCLCYNNYS